MNICFYTGGEPSVGNLLNINYLISKRPNHNYSFVSVAATEKGKPSFNERLKNTYARTRFNDGRYDFEKDNLLLEERVRQHIGDIKRSDFETISVPAVNDIHSEHALDKVRPDMIIQAGAGILKEGVFTRAGIGTINVHHGLAPDIRGVHSTFWCLFYGAKDKIGVTCHMVDKGLDTGAVITQRALSPQALSYVDIELENYLMGREVLVASIDLLEKRNLRVVEKGEVKSYYFRQPDNFLYYALKKRNFNALMKLKDKAFTMKPLRILEAI